MNALNRPPIAHQTGFSLIEVLVSIIILSLGLLGMAGLQATGLKNNYSAHTRAQAAQYAYDMIDRMRANRVVAQAGSYNRALGAAAPACDNLLHCDQAGWLADIATLPAGDGSIAVNGNVVTITIQWNDQRAGGSATATLVIESQL